MARTKVEDLSVYKELKRVDGQKEIGGRSLWGWRKMLVNVNKRRSTNTNVITQYRGSPSNWHQAPKFTRPGLKPVINWRVAQQQSTRPKSILNYEDYGALVIA